MIITQNRTNRRRFVQSAMAAGGLFFSARGAFAEALALTPEQTLGPYYPDRMPLDQDNDLLVINDAITPAVGEISWITGRVLDRTGAPVRNALVEIWQADHNGAYIHSASPIRNRDANFQGYGRFVTASNGEYLFRTVKPGIYPGRTRHIHYAVTAPGQPRFTTQLYIDGEALNNNDGVLNGVRDAAQRAIIVVPWTRLAQSSINELQARFEIVLNYTPADTAPAAGPRVFALGGAVNAANYQSGAAAGSWMTLYGDNLGPAEGRIWRADEVVNGKLPVALEGVKVEVGGQPAPVYYVSGKQLNVQAPTAAPRGNVAVTVTTPAGTSDAVTVNLQDTQPAFFTQSGDIIAAQRTGDTYVLYGTGFGPTTPETPAGETVAQPRPLAQRVRIFIDTLEAQVLYAGLVSAGLYQFNVWAPGLPAGDHAVTADAGGTRTVKIARLRVD